MHESKFIFSFDYVSELCWEDSSLECLSSRTVDFPTVLQYFAPFFIPIISLDKLSSWYITTGLSWSTRDLYGLSGVLLQI